MFYDVAVVGGGPAGLSAAINVRARGKTVAVIANPMEENPLYRAELVDNYLGIPGVTGAQILDAFSAHAREAGVEMVAGRVLTVMPMGERFFLSVGPDVLEAAAVVLATGVARGVKYPGEEALLGRGVSYCATCDGMLYRGKKVAVIGKSPDAPHEAAFLLSLGCEVTYLADKRPDALADGIEFVSARKLEVVGAQRVTGLRADGTEIPCEGVFILRAVIAPADLMAGLALEGAYIKADRSGETNLPGIFAAGDGTGLPLQLAKAVGEGLIAGQSAAAYVEKQKKTKEKGDN